VGNNPKNPAGSVYLLGPKVTDAGLKHLASLSRLQVLRLDSSPKITDDGVKELASLKQFRSLVLLGSEVTPEGAKKPQAALPKCKIVR
jgi:hypothetical protein